MSKTIQLWLAALIGLGAGSMVLAHPTAFATALGAGQKFISGTEATAIGR